MTDDEKFDEFLRQAAAGYNRPAEVPRDAMWEAIRAERARRREGAPAALPVEDEGARQAAPTIVPVVAHAASSGARVLRFPSRARHWTAAAAAAVLLLAAGIGIGRMTSPAAPERRVARRDDVPVPIPPPPIIEQQRRTVAAPEAGTREAPASARHLASAASVPGAPRRPGAPRASTPPDEAARPSEAASPHGFALAQHLARSEALLVAFRAEAREGRLDGELSAWARDLLSSTRLLLDSPAAGDPRRRRMLEDLELVLVQIVHLAPDTPDDEREQVGRAIEQGDMLTRIRATVPAGAVSSGT